jgi:hypothetical protein
VRILPSGTLSRLLEFDLAPGLSGGFDPGALPFLLIGEMTSRIGMTYSSFVNGPCRARGDKHDRVGAKHRSIPSAPAGPGNQEVTPGPGRTAREYDGRRICVRYSY